MEKMSRNRRKEKPVNLGPMRAARPMDDTEDMQKADMAIDRARKAFADTGMTPRPDVEERAMEEVGRERRRSMMGEAYDRAMTGMKKGGSVSSASARADGCAQRGKTRGKFV